MGKLLRLLGFIFFILLFASTIGVFTQMMNYPPQYEWFFGLIPIIIFGIAIIKLVKG